MIKRKINRNFRIVLTGAAIAAVTVLCSLGKSMDHVRKEEKHEALAAQKKEPYCVVYEYDGKLAAAHYGHTEPYMILDVRTAMLSEYDREQFRKGVELATEADLKKLIEDFSD
ncbi:MAG: hypothetical protein MJ100_08290 [Ruminococcus sp.]|nr:hypothetical protein [Ruminococcus sp.]